MAFSSQSFTAPSIKKLNRRTISSPLSSSVSKISGVTPKLKTSRMRFFRPSLKKTNVTAEEITQKSSIEDALVETNRILVEIQKQLSFDFAMRIAEEKEKQQTLKKEKSKKRFGMEEGALESAKRIGSELCKTTSKILSPVKGFFDKILAFLGFLAAGFLTNAVFGWLSKEENQKKLQKFFNILTQNWKLFAKILGTAFLGVLAVKMLGFASAIAGIIGFLSTPVVLTILATLAGLAAGTFALGEATKAGIDKVQKATYGEGNAEKGAFITSLLDNYGRISSQEERSKLTDEEKTTAHFLYQYDQMLKDRQTINDQLFNVKERTTGFGKIYEEGRRQRISELEEKLRAKDNSIAKVETEGVRIQGKNLKELFDIYSVSGALPKTSIQARAMGGPVMAGRTYLVGEKGPELFSPNIDGSIVNNMRTEKIYNMISNNPKRNRKVNIQTMDLPPITVPMGGEGSTSSPSPAPSVPTISSRNILDSMRNETPGIYGIYV